MPQNVLSIFQKRLHYKNYSFLYNHENTNIKRLKLLIWNWLLNAHYETLYLLRKYAIIEISNNLDEIFMVVNIHSYYYFFT